MNTKSSVRFGLQDVGRNAAPQRHAITHEPRDAPINAARAPLHEP